MPPVSNATTIKQLTPSFTSLSPNTISSAFKEPHGCRHCAPGYRTMRVICGLSIPDTGIRFSMRVQHALSIIAIH